MTLKLCSIAAALALALGSTAVRAQQTPGTSADKSTSASASRSAQRDEQKAGKEKIAADYKAAKTKCDAMQGNQKDVCMKEAKGQEKVAKAELAAKRNPSARNERKVAEAKADAEYDVAKEKCEDMKGNEKSACEKDARAKYNQAKADIKKQYASRKQERPARSATSGATSSGGTMGNGSPGTTK